MESKDEERKDDDELPLFKEAARYFKDQAFCASKDEGLEVVFDDFVCEHAAGGRAERKTRPSASPCLAEARIAAATSSGSSARRRATVRAESSVACAGRVRGRRGDAGRGPQLRVYGVA